MDRRQALALWFLPLALLFALPDCAQVRARRGKDGVIRITDQDDGTEGETTDAFGLKWQKKNKVIEVFDPATRSWIPSPKDFPFVLSSENLVLAYGPGQEGCAVYDVLRRSWMVQREGFIRGQVSAGLAVGYGDDTRIVIYDRKKGKWETARFGYERLLLSANFLVLYGPGTRTQVYDSGAGSWVTENFNNFDQCVLGETLAVFYKREAAGASVFDSLNHTFIPLNDIVESAQAVDRIAVARTNRGNYYAYSTRDMRWTSLGQARSVAVLNGEIRLTDAHGYASTFRPTEFGFQIVYPNGPNYR